MLKIAGLLIAALIAGLASLFKAADRDDIQDATGRRTYLAPIGNLRGVGDADRYQVTANTVNGIAGNPINAEAGWSPGATFQNPYATALGQFLWVNVGSSTSATWLNIA